MRHGRRSAGLPRRTPVRGPAMALRTARCSRRLRKITAPITRAPKNMTPPKSGPPPNMPTRPPAVSTPMTITTIERVLSSRPIAGLAVVVRGHQQPQGAVRQDADAEQGSSRRTARGRSSDRCRSAGRVRRRLRRPSRSPVVRRSRPKSRTSSRVTRGPSAYVVSWVRQGCAGGRTSGLPRGGRVSSCWFFGC